MNIQPRIQGLINNLKTKTIAESRIHENSDLPYFIILIANFQSIAAPNTAFSLKFKLQKNTENDVILLSKRSTWMSFHVYKKTYELLFLPNCLPCLGPQNEGLLLDVPGKTQH